MRHVRLVPEMETSALGYGCASLMARTGRAESVRLLEVAFDCGITHFDVARSYGYGEAEGAVGEFLATRRDRVTVTTKLGITPPARSGTLSAAKGIARAVSRASPRLRRHLRSYAGRMTTAGAFDVDAARASFEQSLRELRTDYVDVLALHDVQPGDLNDDLVSYLDDCVARGRARTIAVATDRRSARAITTSAPRLGAVVQVPDAVVTDVAPGRAIPEASAFVTHSVLATGLAIVEAYLDAAPGRRATWSARVATDLDEPGALGRVLLGQALARNPDGIVLVATRNEEHLRANAGVGGGQANGDRLVVLDRLFREARDEQAPSPAER